LQHLKTPAFTLGKAQRLKSRKAIDQLFAGGKSFMVPPVRVVYAFGAKKDMPVLQAGFGVSTRYFKKATQRNRVKRLLRECWRLQKSLLETQLQDNNCQLQVFILFTDGRLPTYPELYPKIALVIKKLSQIKYEKVTPLA
jgi:ribonuclease P protein component